MSTWNLCGCGSSPLTFSWWIAWLRILRIAVKKTKELLRSLSPVRPVAGLAGSVFCLRGSQYSEVSLTKLSPALKSRVGYEVNLHLNMQGGQIYGWE